MEQIKSILEAIGHENIALAILFLSIFIDISPGIKFNPWKWLFGKIGKYINGSIEHEIAGFKKDVYAKIDDLKTTQQKEFDEIREEQRNQADTLKSLITDMKYKEISRIRWDVINFRTRIQHGDKYPREQYRHIVDEAEKFMRMVSGEGDSEDKLMVDPEDIIKIEESIEEIKKHYESHKNSDSASFLI